MTIVLIYLIIININIINIISQKLRLFHTINSILYVSKHKSNSNNNNNQDSYSDFPVSLFDEYGSIPQLDSAYFAISKSSPIAVIAGNNFTLVAYKISSFAQSDNSFTILQSPIASKPLHMLINPYQHIVLTGIIGDCRKVAIFAKESVLNHTIEYGVPPSGFLIANKIGEYLQSFSMGGETRPLACHCFVLSSVEREFFAKSNKLLNDEANSSNASSDIKNSNISSNRNDKNDDNINDLMTHKHGHYVINQNKLVFEVLSDGTVTQVYAGIAGGELNNNILYDSYQLNITSDDAKSLINKLFNSNSNKSDSESNKLFNIRYHMFS